MALLGANLGTGGNATASTSIIISTGTITVVGTLCVLCIAYDNSGASGADPFSTIVDSLGNTWTSRINSLNDPGAASAGSTLRIFTSTIGSVNVASTVTVNFSASTTAKAWTLTEIGSTTSGGVAVYLTGAQATGSGTTQTITSTSIAAGDLILGVLGQEGNGTRTADADTTNGSWSTAQSTGFGTTTSGIEIISQNKTVVLAGTQTFNPVATPLGDWCIAWISATEVISTSFDPFGMNGIFGI
jgi:hypothetical protein